MDYSAFQRVDDKLVLPPAYAKYYYTLIGFLVGLCVILNLIFEYNFLIFPGNALIGIWAAIMMIWYMLLRCYSTRLHRIFEYIISLYGVINFITYITGNSYSGAWFIIWSLLLIKDKPKMYDRLNFTKIPRTRKGVWYFFLVIAFLISTLTVIQGILSAEIVSYPPIAGGQFYTLTTDGRSYRVHMLCTGELTTNNHTIMLQHGGGAPGLSLYGIQLKLSKLGYKVCTMDRSGYGYSDPGLYLPHTDDKWVQDSIKVFEMAGITGPKIVVGHSVGGQLAIKICGVDTSYKGAILLDSVQANYIKEMDSKVPDTYYYGYTDEQINKEYAGISGAIGTYRFLWAWGLVAMLTGGHSNFEPADQGNRFAVLYHQDKVWQSQYYDWTGGLPVESADQFASKLKFKDFPIHTLRAVSNCTNTVLPTDGDKCDKMNTLYSVYKDAALRQISITGKGSLEFCKQPCDHGFPWSQVDMAVSFIQRKIQNITGQGV